MYPILIGCDCDPDRNGFTSDIEEHTLSWEGIEKGIETFRSERNSYFLENGVKPIVTWYVRADFQIEKVHGDAGYCLERFYELWKQLEDEGDEIGWHPHLWDWDKKKKIWYQNINSPEFTKKCLEKGLEGFERHWGKKPTSTHAGWCYQDNITTSILSDLGIKIDSSALPGHNTISNGISDRSDWSRAPLEPYRPSFSDYQAPFRTNDKVKLDIIQIPTSVGESFLANFFKFLRDMFKRKSFQLDLKRFKTQAPLITLSRVFSKKLIETSIENSFKLESSYFMTYFHCDELLPITGKSGVPKLIYSMDNFFTNISIIEKKLSKKGETPHFQNLANYVRDNELEEKL